MNDLRLELRFKNSKLFEAIENRFRVERGSRYGCCRLAAATIGISEIILSGYLTLRLSPWIRGSGDQWSTVPAGNAKKIADFFEMECEELFPISLYRLNIPRLAVRLIDSERMLSFQEARQWKLLPASIIPDYENINMGELADVVARSLSTLTPREAEVIASRFGLSGSSDTLKQIGNKFGVTVERIRQIEAKALRKLRDPKRARILKPFVEKGPACQT